MFKKLKQFFVLSFMVYYLGLSLGLSINLHYCEGKVASIAFLTEKASCSKHDNSCESICKSEQSTIINHCLRLNKQQCCVNKNLYLHFESTPVVPVFNPDFNAKVIELYASIKVIRVINTATLSSEAPFDFIESESYPPPFLLFQQFLVYS